jgi:putative ABC transport system permease protein
MTPLLHGMLGLLPRAFRERFGDEIAAQVDIGYAEARAQGMLAALLYVLGTAGDLIVCAIAERARPTWRATDPIQDEDVMLAATGQGMMLDLRHAARALRRSRGFTAIAVGVLGLAIGVSAGMFEIVKTVLLDPLPFAHTDRLYYISASAPGSQFPDEFGVSNEFFLHYKARSRYIEELSTTNSFTSTMRAGDRVERIRMSWPTTSIFATLGATPILGRLPVAEDEDRVAVISHALWTTWFGGDSSVIGRRYVMSGEAREVIGVMGPEFRFPDDDTRLWISNHLGRADVRLGQFFEGLVARVKPGVTPEMLATELTAISKELPGAFGGDAGYLKLIGQHRAVVRPLRDQIFRNVSRPLFILLASVTIVLLVACANVANLFLIRAEARQREYAVRRAIGAARGQLLRLQLAEALVVATAAALVAVVLAGLTLPALRAMAPANIPRIGAVAIDASTVGYTILAALVAALACGLIPALRASAPDLARLRDGSRGSTRERGWLRSGLVIGQTALALVLLIGSGLLLRSFVALRSVDPGYDTTDVFTFQIAAEGDHLPDGPAYARFSLAFMERLRALPGVQSVGLVENVPLNEGTATASFRTEEMGSDSSASARLDYTFAAGDYYRTMGIRVVAGRTFEDADQLGTGPLTAVISRSAAERLWPGQDPLGRRLLYARSQAWATVIGVVEDVRQDGFREAGSALVYLPMVGPRPRTWVIGSPAYVVKTPRAETIAPEIRELARQVAPEAPMYRVFTMEGLARDSMIHLSFTMVILGIVSALALILGAVGLYGVLSYVVAQRTREIGIRMALGADSGRVQRMVVAQGTRVVLVGVGIGLVAAYVSTRALTTLLFDVEAIDISTFAAMAASMLAVGLLATWLPARRASSVSPLESLRGE